LPWCSGWYSTENILQAGQAQQQEHKTKENVRITLHRREGQIDSAEGVDSNVLVVGSANRLQGAVLLDMEVRLVAAVLAKPVRMVMDVVIWKRLTENKAPASRPRMGAYER
jgi:glyoxylate utilization-related uncharacterized protein